MSKLVVSEFVTIDGVFEAPGGGEAFERGGWAFQFDRSPEGDKFKLDELMAAEVMLLGRVTYDGFAKAWPAMNADEFGKKMNSMPKYVVSTTVEEGSWTNTTVIKGDVREAVERLKRELDGDILVAGSARLVQTLVAHDLIDEYRLMVFPVILGAGKRLFGETEGPKKLRLAEARPAGETTILVYDRA